VQKRAGRAERTQAAGCCVRRSDREDACCIRRDRNGLSIVVASSRNDVRAVFMGRVNLLFERL
jgi:hypothetical protein